MKRFLAVLAVLALSIPAMALAQPEIKSKAEKVTITGRVHAQWSHSSLDGDPNNEFFIRRARATVKVKINDMWSGQVQPDFGRGVLSLKNAFVRAEPMDGVFEITIGQTKRAFDLFELVSSTEHLVIERDGRIGRTSVPSLSRLTEKLGYSDRDIGVFAAWKPENERVNIYGAISNGSGANRLAAFSKKAYQARVTVVPIKDKNWELYGGVSTRPYAAAIDTMGTGGAASEEKYATAFEVSTQYGGFKKGLIGQLGFVTGHNWNGEKTDYDRATDFEQKPPSFVAVQGIVAFTHHLQGREAGWLRAIRPLVRVSWADPNTDDEKGGMNDAGTVITPGFDFVTNARNRIAVNVDIFKPEVGDTEYGTKVQAYMYW